MEEESYLEIFKTTSEKCPHLQKNQKIKNY